MKVFITKYALTRGIIEAEAIQESDTIIAVRYPNCPFNKHYHLPDWFPDKDAAIKRAEKMRFKKITKLELDITYLKTLRFK